MSTNIEDRGVNITPGITTSLPWFGAETYERGEQVRNGWWIIPSAILGASAWTYGGWCLLSWLL